MNKEYEQYPHYSSLHAVDKALAITPLLHLMVHGKGDLKEVFTNFVTEFEAAKGVFKESSGYGNRVEARLAFLVSSLMQTLAADDNANAAPSEIIKFAADEIASLKASSADFNSSIPLENGFWGIEVAAVTSSNIRRHPFLLQHKERLNTEMIAAINKVSELLSDNESIQIIRSKNSISRYMASEMNALLNPPPKNENELNSCLDAYRAVVGSFYEILRQIQTELASI